jgi:hypothetical protein
VALRGTLTGTRSVELVNFRIIIGDPEAWVVALKVEPSVELLSCGSEGVLSMTKVDCKVADCRDGDDSREDCRSCYCRSSEREPRIDTRSVLDI